MKARHWQKQPIHFQALVWGAAALISIFLIMLLLLLEFRVEVAAISFIVVFIILRTGLAYLLNNRYANSMVRILKFGFKELERDFRFIFKEQNVVFYRHIEEDSYRYEFPGYGLNMIVQPYWLAYDMQPVTKITLRELTAENEAFAEMLAAAIDEMAEQRKSGREQASKLAI